MLFIEQGKIVPPFVHKKRRRPDMYPFIVCGATSPSPLHLLGFDLYIPNNNCFSKLQIVMSWSFVQDLCRNGRKPPFGVENTVFEQYHVLNPAASSSQHIFQHHEDQKDPNI